MIGVQIQVPMMQCVLVSPLLGHVGGRRVLGLRRPREPPVITMVEGMCLVTRPWI